jgi:D-sedoheptulose 7-phosphate isomerase
MSAPGGTGFLYPFLDAAERDAGPLLEDLARSAEAKAAESAALRANVLAASEDELSAVGLAMAARFDAGGRLLAMGNGGSSTDAASLVTLFGDPPAGRPLPARSLADDLAVLTALGNDVGFEVVFLRQVIAQVEPSDMVVGFSTSGGSKNLLLAFDEACERGCLTVGLAGYQGGQMAVSPSVQHCFVVPSQSIHRIQETQAALSWRLWEVVQAALRPLGPS